MFIFQPNDIGLPHFLCSIFGYQDFKSTEGVDVLQNNIKKFCQGKYQKSGDTWTSG